MEKADTQALLQTYITQSALALLRDLGAAFELTEPTEWLPEITAVLGIAGPSVAGSIALSTSEQCLLRLAELGSSTMPEDWLGELANQLVGRFKRRISPHGASFSLGTPTVIIGERLRMAVGVARKRSIVVRLQSSIGRIEIWLEFELRDGCELSAEPKEDDALIEGEALLF